MDKGEQLHQCGVWRGQGTEAGDNYHGPEKEETSVLALRMERGWQPDEEGNTLSEKLT